MFADTLPAFPLIESSDFFVERAYTCAPDLTWQRSRKQSDRDAIPLSEPLLFVGRGRPCIGKSVSASGKPEKLKR